MTIDIVDLGKFLVAISLVVCIFCLANLFKKMADSVKTLNKSLEKTQKTMDELNHILNNTNQLTENIKDVSGGIKKISGGLAETLKTVEDSYDLIRKLLAKFNRIVTKKNNE